MAFYTHMHKCINTQEITVGMKKHTHIFPPIHSYFS